MRIAFDRGRIVVAAAAVGVVIVAANDGQNLALGGVRLYQRSVAPLVALTGIRCRFTPTCSRYAEIVIARDGVMRGGWETVKRITRCGPWTAAGTLDDP